MVFQDASLKDTFKCLIVKIFIKWKLTKSTSYSNLFKIHLWSLVLLTLSTWSTVPHPEVRKIYGKYCVGEGMKKQSHLYTHWRKCILEKLREDKLRISKFKIHLLFYWTMMIWAYRYVHKYIQTYMQTMLIAVLFVIRKY